MKTLRIIFVFILIGVVIQVSAQEKGNSEIKLGYGVITSTQTINDIEQIFEMAFTLGSISYINEKSTGAIHLGYNYFLSNKFTLGVNFAYEQIKSDVKSGNDAIGDMNATFYTVSIESCFHYVRKEKINMYSGLGLAYSFGNIDFNSSTTAEDSFSSTANIPNFQIIGFGIRGGNTFAGFAEVGFGYKGVICAGLSVKL